MLEPHSTLADDYPEAYLKKILTEVTTVALVGASPRVDRDSYLVMQVLLDQGYTVFPVNPREAGNTILGQYCFDSLLSINMPVDMVDIFRSPDAALGITQQAIAIDVKVVWMQLNIVNHQAAELATAAGVQVVMNRCPKLEFEKPYWVGMGN